MQLACQASRTVNAFEPVFCLRFPGALLPTSDAQTLRMRAGGRMYDQPTWRTTTSCPAAIAVPPMVVIFSAVAIPTAVGIVIFAEDLAQQQCNEDDYRALHFFQLIC